ncbi:MAG: uracil-DNA glycosylase [Nitrosopumilus sp.]|nr:uracil-DNA glycosylase [Nitrosopumilus sp.]NNL36947.1 uracil-DNA glycosylase [Nitrosopumilus sp.]
MKSIVSLNKKIASCKKCPRLTQYIQDVATNKVRRFKDEKYYGKPLSGFGDVKAKLLIVGLAPAAHGGNRTGRMFTGDSSGDWVAKVMHKHGFASIPTSQSLNDGLVLHNAYITAAVRCAPPQNKPTKQERDTCFEYLQQEKEILNNVTTILCLGKIAYDAVCRLYEVKIEKFGHNKLFCYDEFNIITSYHPSKQNTQTGRLTWTQWSAVFSKAKKLSKKIQ